MDFPEFFAFAIVSKRLGKHAAVELQRCCFATRNTSGVCGMAHVGLFVN